MITGPGPSRSPAPRGAAGLPRRRAGVLGALEHALQLMQLHAAEHDALARLLPVARQGTRDGGLGRPPWRWALVAVPLGGPVARRQWKSRGLVTHCLLAVALAFTVTVALALTVVTVALALTVTVALALTVTLAVTVTVTVTLAVSCLHDLVCSPAVVRCELGRRSLVGQRHGHRLGFCKGGKPHGEIRASEPRLWEAGGKGQQHLRGVGPAPLAQGTFVSGA